MTQFADQLHSAISSRGNPVLVGLDPRWQLLPEALKQNVPAEPKPISAAYEQFCREVIDVVAPLVAAVKPQAAFFEEQGPAGMAALHAVVQYAQQKGLLVILDGKRKDIGSTAEAYANAYLGRASSAWGADALTVSPYLGNDSLQPFVDAAHERDAGIFVLVKTSNPGGATFQDVEVEGRPIYRRVAEHVESLAASNQGDCGYGSIGAVVGATYPEHLAELREAMPHTWFLVPGFGSQGGTAEDVAAAFDSAGMGAVINNSRGILFAHRREEYSEKFGERNWQRAVQAATLDMIAQLESVIG